MDGIRLFLYLGLVFLIFTVPVSGDTEGIIHYPISGITVMPGNPDFISDETDDPIVEVTEFDFSIPSFVELFLDTFHIHDVPVWAAETIVIIIGIITTIVGIVTSGYLFFLYTRRKLSEDPKSNHMIILAYLLEHPGSQQSEIIKATRYSRGSVSYNLKRLEQEGRIYKTGDTFACYYPIGFSPAEKDRKAWKVLENGTRMHLFQVIMENPGISQRQLSKEAGIPMTTMRWHLDKLVNVGLILVEIRKNTTCYSANPGFSEVYITRLESELVVCE